MLQFRFQKIILLLLIFQIFQVAAQPTQQKNKNSSLPGVGKIIGQEDFVPVNADASNIPAPFRPLVEAIGWTNYGCTVTHIGHGYALSAGHCFEAGEQLEVHRSCQFVHVDWGYRYNKEPTMKSDCEVIVAMQNHGDVDFALLKMKTYPAAAIQPNMHKMIAPLEQITIFSHPEGSPLNWSQYCAIENKSFARIPAGQLAYACDTLGGSSGAVLIETSTLQVVGIHRGGWPEMNYGTHLLNHPLSDELAKIGF